MAEKALVPEVIRTSKLDEVHQGKASAPSWRAKALGEIPHLDQAATVKIAKAARSLGQGHKGERDKLLGLVLFDACLRISKALFLAPVDIVKTEGGFRLRVMGKGQKRAEVMINHKVAAQLYLYITETGACHVLCHSGAIAQPKATRDSRALQKQLRYLSPAMTLRYLKTIAKAEALQVQDAADLLMSAEVTADF